MPPHFQVMHCIGDFPVFPCKPVSVSLYIENEKTCNVNNPGGIDYFKLNTI